MSPLNYHHLRYFWMVAREGSLRKAAERLNISQPTVSAQIAQLEESLGQLLFRRTGRNLVLTPAGTRAYEIAQEIFTLGEELVAQVQHHEGDRALSLHLGIADSLPKLISWNFIEPALRLGRPVRLHCREGRTQELLALMVAGKIEIVISDEKSPSALPFKTTNHLLGVSGTTFCSAEPLWRKYRQGFPDSLNGAPMLLPSSSTAWRLELDRWLGHTKLKPEILAEFDDAALLKVAGHHGLGIIPVPTLVEEEAISRYGFKVLGRVKTCRIEYYAITPQRRNLHPAILKILSGKSPPRP